MLRHEFLDMFSGRVTEVAGRLPEGVEIEKTRPALTTR
jgi:hypothetical protein